MFNQGISQGSLIKEGIYMKSKEVCSKAVVASCWKRRCDVGIPWTENFECPPKVYTCDE